ncbi:hypothetical protein MauCBS54593_006305 [Microsporum audouinii]
MPPTLENWNMTMRGTSPQFSPPSTLYIQRLNIMWYQDMVNAVKRALESMFNDVLKSKNGLKRILNPSAAGPGSRLYPPKDPKKEEKYGIRIDKGELVNGQNNILRLKLQANSNAANKTIRDMAKADSHADLATADIDITQEQSEENLNALKDMFFESLEKK